MKKYQSASIEVIVVSTERIMWDVLYASGNDGAENYTNGVGAATLDFGQLK